MVVGAILAPRGIMTQAEGPDAGESTPQLIGREGEVLTVIGSGGRWQERKNHERCHSR